MAQLELNQFLPDTPGAHIQRAIEFTGCGQHHGETCHWPIRDTTEPDRLINAIRSQQHAHGVKPDARLVARQVVCTEWKDVAALQDTPETIDQTPRTEGALEDLMVCRDRD